jgi:hypothetical protein
MKSAKKRVLSAAGRAAIAKPGEEAVGEVEKGSKESRQLRSRRKTHIVIIKRIATPTLLSGSCSTRTTSARYSVFIGSFSNVNGYVTNKRMPTR